MLSCKKKNIKEKHKIKTLTLLFLQSKTGSAKNGLGQLCSQNWTSRTVHLWLPNVDPPDLILAAKIGPSDHTFCQVHV